MIEEPSDPPVHSAKGVPQAVEGETSVHDEAQSQQQQSQHHELNSSHASKEEIAEEKKYHHSSSPDALRADGEAFLNRPVKQIENPNKRLKKAYGKNYFKAARFDHLRILRKIRNEGNDSVSSHGNSDDQLFTIKGQMRQRGSRGGRGRGRSRAQSKQTSNAAPHKRRGRPPRKGAQDPDQKPVKKERKTTKPKKQQQQSASEQEESQSVSSDSEESSLTESSKEQIENDQKGDQKIGLKFDINGSSSSESEMSSQNYDQQGQKKKKTIIAQIRQRQINPKNIKKKIKQKSSEESQFQQDEQYSEKDKGIKVSKNKKVQNEHQSKVKQEKKDTNNKMIAQQPKIVENSQNLQSLEARLKKLKSKKGRKSNQQKEQIQKLTELIKEMKQKPTLKQQIKTPTVHTTKQNQLQPKNEQEQNKDDQRVVLEKNILSKKLVIKQQEEKEVQIVKASPLREQKKTIINHQIHQIAVQSKQIQKVDASSLQSKIREKIYNERLQKLSRSSKTINENIMVTCKLHKNELELFKKWTLMSQQNQSPKFQIVAQEENIELEQQIPNEDQKKRSKVNTFVRHRKMIVDSDYQNEQSNKSGKKRKKSKQSKQKEQNKSIQKHKRNEQPIQQ